MAERHRFCGAKPAPIPEERKAFETKAVVIKMKENDGGGCPQFVRTPPMVLNEVSRLCMTLLHQMSGEDPHGSKQHSRRLILMKLSRDDGITQCELVKASKMTAPTISVTLKSLEQDGLVERRGDPEDMRATRVYLTEKGREVDRKNRERVRLVDEIMMRGLTETEQEELMDLLLKMRENLIEELKEKNEAD